VDGNAGVVRERIRAHVDGDGLFPVAMNVRYLLDVAKHTEADELRLEFSAPDQPVWVRHLLTTADEPWGGFPERLTLIAPAKLDGVPDPDAPEEDDDAAG
jgi:DNA polymerase III sliding clamp (beta) subunit (PCNA family)